MVWPSEKYLDFIQDYRKCEVLWDTRNSNYKNNRIKRNVLLDLAQKYDLDEARIKKKIKNLRCAFHREHNRLTNKKSCSGLPNGNDSKKWFAYESLKFLLDVIEPRSEPRSGTSNTIEVKTEDVNLSGDGNTIENVERKDIIDPKMHQLNLTRKRKKIPLNRLQAENERRAEVYQIFNNNKRDEHSVYGEYVGNELRKLSHISQTYVKHIISNVLFKAALGHYDSRQIESNRIPESESEPSPSASYSLESNGDSKSILLSIHDHPYTIPIELAGGTQKNTNITTHESVLTEDGNDT